MPDATAELTQVPITEAPPPEREKLPTEPVPSNTEKPARSERENKEIATSLLLPQPLQKEILEKPESLAKLKENEPVILGIGTQEKPAHAFQFSYYGLSPELKSQFDQRVSSFFQQHPDAGFLTHMRPEALKGVFMTRNMDMNSIMVELEALVVELNALKEAMQSSGEYALFLSEFPELEVGLYPMGKDHTALETTQTAGLTMLSWAAKEAGRQSKGVGRINWVSTSPEKPGYDTNIQSDVSWESETDPIVLDAPTEKGIADKLYIRPYTGDPSKHSVEELALRVQELKNKEPGIDYSSLSEDQLDLLMQVSSAGFSSSFFLDKLRSDPAFGEKIEQEGFAELITTGEHVSIKFDYSGMSKLVSQGENPQEFLKGLFGSFASEIDTVLAQKQYLLGTEGDAVILYIPTDSNIPQTERLTQLLSVNAAIRNVYAAKVREGINSGVLNGSLSEHETGLKTYSSALDGKAKIRFYKNGSVSIDDEGFSRHEDYGEKRAKQGGAGMTVVVDKLLEPEEAENVFGTHTAEQLSDGKFLYRLKDQTVLSLGFQEAVKSISANGSMLGNELAKFCDLVDQAAWTQNNNNANLHSIDNNSFEAAKWIYAITRIAENNPLIVLDFFQQLSLKTSPRTTTWFREQFGEIKSGQHTFKDPGSMVAVAYKLIEQIVPRDPKPK